MNELAQQIQFIANRLGVKITEITLDEISYDMLIAQTYPLSEAMANIPSSLEYRGPFGRMTIHRQEKESDGFGVEI